MRKNGTIYRMENGQICVGFTKDQLPHFAKCKRTFLRYFDDYSCITPTIFNGKRVIGVKHLKDLVIIGFINPSNKAVMLNDYCPADKFNIF